jgi:hypothetical protein
MFTVLENLKLDDSGCPMIVVNHSEKEKNEVQAILPVDYKTPEPIKPVIKPENMQNAAPIKTENVQEEIKVVRKKKRKLS